VTNREDVDRALLALESPFGSPLLAGGYTSVIRKFLDSERLIRDEWDVVLDEHGSADTYLIKEEAVAAAARMSTPHDKLEVVHIRLYEVTD
jgi:hypothetical protein